jgi:hypothetical protein
MYCVVIETRQAYQVIRKSNWHNPRTQARARKGIHEALLEQVGVLSVTNARWLCALKQTSDLSCAQTSSCLKVTTLLSMS